MNFGWLNWTRKSYLLASLLLNNFLCGVDLEKRAQDYVLKTRQIEIPGHPFAFNASIVNWRGHILLSFRDLPARTEEFISDIQSSSLSCVGLVFLNDDLSIDGDPYILDLPGATFEGEILARSEDARLINVDERLYIVYSDNRNKVITEGGFRMHVGELDFDGKKFVLSKIESLTDFPGQSQKRREKNWVPFDYNGNLLLSYSLFPHKVLRPLLDGSESCDLVATSKSNISWKWGELRGGTPALKVGSEYLAFFHSSINIATDHSGEKVMPHYFIGAYTFEKDPPFRITKISKEPIIGKDFYHGRKYLPYWHPVRVVFPCGYIFYQNHILLAYGRQDHEIWIAKLDKEALLRSLVLIN